MNELYIKTTLPNGDQISTTLLSEHVGEVYETVIFFRDGESRDLERYHNQLHAIEGHIKYCQNDWWASL